MKLKDASILFSKINEKFLLPVLWVQGTENDTAHRVVSPEEEPVGKGGREKGELWSEGSRKMEGGLRSSSRPSGMTVEQELCDALTRHLGRRTEAYAYVNNQQPDTGQNGSRKGPTEAPPRVMASATGKVGRGQGALRSWKGQ